jgi:hypothetical protein
METKLFLGKKRIEGLDDGWMSDEAVFFVFVVDGGESDSPVECS